MALKEPNRIRIERLTARLASRRAGAAKSSARAAFDAAFVQHREQVIVPLLRDLGVELAKAGHSFRIEPDGDHRRPSLVFHVELVGEPTSNANAIGFFVQHDDTKAKSEVIAYLALKNDFDVGRFRDAAEMTRDRLEQMLVDALEHMLVCNE